MTNIYHWLALISVIGFKQALFKTLIERYSSPERVFQIPLQELIKTAGLSPEIAKSIKNFNKGDEVNREIELMKEKGIGFSTIGEKDYPPNLLQIHDPPPCLYHKGEINKDNNLAIAIVGARQATHYGITIAERIAGELAVRGVTIVSGMARGIDTAAHRGALQSGGRTIAVLGSGIDIIYPSENAKLFQEITRNGAVISEFPLSTPPLPRNFPMRNRVISGLSLGTVVIEASIKSGSLITANMALDQGREVFAVPGSINSKTSRGTNKLIKDGAKLVACTDDILEELTPQLNLPIKTRNANKKSPSEISIQQDRSKTLNPDEKSVWNSLSDDLKHIDTIINENQLKGSAIYAILLNLEIKNLIQEHPGKYYSRVN